MLNLRSNRNRETQVHHVMFLIWAEVPYYPGDNTINNRGAGSSVGTATGYRLDGPGSNPGGNEIFHPSRPDLGPTQ